MLFDIPAENQFCHFCGCSKLETHFLPFGCRFRLYKDVFSQIYDNGQRKQLDNRCLHNFQGICSSQTIISIYRFVKFYFFLREHNLDPKIISRKLLLSCFEYEVMNPFLSCGYFLYGAA